jgi:O-antigen/teichoic acid export membrane protein
MANRLVGALTTLGRFKILVMRLGWSLTDQLLFSLTNAALSILVARAVDAQRFGAFAIAFAVYSFYIGLQRALVSEPLMMRWAGASQDKVRDATASCVGAAALMGCLVGAVVSLAGLVVGGASGSALLALAVSLPGLGLQDAWRTAFFASGRPRSAASNDALCAVLQLTGTVVVIQLGYANIVLVVLVWGLGTSIGGAFGCWQDRQAPSVGTAAAWLRSTLDLWRYLVPEYVGVMGGYQLAVLSVGAVGSAADVGALRSAAVLLGPISIVSMGIQTFVVPELARRKGREPRYYRRVAVAVSGAHVLINLVWGGLLLALPSPAGHALLGDSWLNGRSLLPASILGQAAIGATIGVGVVLVAFQSARDLLRLSFLLPPLHIVLGIGGAVLAGVRGAALGFAIAACCIVPAWWRKLSRFLQQYASQELSTDDAGIAELH